VHGELVPRGVLRGVTRCDAWLLYLHYFSPFILLGILVVLYYILALGGYSALLVAKEGDLIPHTLIYRSWLEDHNIKKVLLSETNVSSYCLVLLVWLVDIVRCRSTHSSPPRILPYRRYFCALRRSLPYSCADLREIDWVYVEYAASTRRLPGFVGGAAYIHHFLGGDRTIPEVLLHPFDGSCTFCRLYSYSSTLKMTLRTTLL
jgi:hypothetical protein